MNKFDKPYNIITKFDQKKTLELFRYAAKLEIHELIQYAYINQLPLNIFNDNGNNLIHEIINTKNTTELSKLNAIKLLVLNNVNPDKINKDDVTPLHIACSNQFEHIVKYLVDIKVNVNRLDKMGSTPVHYLLKGDIKMFEIKEIKSLVPYNKSPNINKNKLINDLKHEIINNLLTNVNVPLLDTLKKTIFNIISSDSSIKNYSNYLKNEIAKKSLTELSTLDSTNNLLLYYKEFIKSKITSLLGISKIPIEIHPKEYTSWGPENIGEPDLSNYGLIKNGDNKKYIKKLFKDTIGDIKNLNSRFKVTQHYKLLEEGGEYFIKIFGYYLKKYEKDTKYIEINNHLYYELDPDPPAVPPPPPPAVPPPPLFRSKQSEFTKLNRDMIHKYAIDNEAPIIDIKNMTYTAAGRPLIITEFNAGPRPFIINPIVNNYDIIYNLIFYLTVDNAYLPFDITTITFANINNNINDLLISIWYLAILKPNEFDDYIKRLLNQLESIRAQRQLAIIIPHIPIPILNAPPLIISFAPPIYGVGGPPPPPPPPLPLYVAPHDLQIGSVNSKLNFYKFITKWYYAYVNNKYTNIGLWLFNMYNEYAILWNIIPAQSYETPYSLLLLVSSLINNSSNIIEGINSISKQFYDKNITNEGELNEYINYLLNINAIINIIDPNTFANNRNIDIACKKILDIYSEMTNKPLLQTILNIIFLLKNYHLPPPPPLPPPFAPPPTFYDRINQFLHLYNYTNFTRFINNPHNKYSPIYNMSTNMKKFIRPGINKYTGYEYQHFLIAYIFGMDYQGCVPAIKYIDVSYPNDVTEYTNIKINAIIEAFKNNAKGAGKGNNNERLTNILNLPIIGRNSTVNLLPVPPAAPPPIHIYMTQLIQNLNASHARILAALAALAVVVPPVIPPQQSLLYNALLHNSVELLSNANTLGNERKIELYKHTVNGINYIKLPLYEIEARSDMHYFIPTYYNYFYMLIEKVYILQYNINILIVKIERIINQTVRGITTNLKQVFTELYPELLFNCKQLEYNINSIKQFNELYKDDNDINKFNDDNTLGIDVFKKYQKLENYDFSELAKILNKINSYYYIYYYIYRQNQMIDLPAFNYYQIPISDNSNEYMYYNNNNNTRPNDNTHNIQLNFNDTFPINPVAGVPGPTNLKNYNNLNIGNYENLLLEYYQGKYPTNNYLLTNDLFRIAKNETVPPSLYNSLKLFFELVLKKIISDYCILANQININKINDILDILNIPNNVNKSLIKYEILCNVLQTGIIDIINNYIESSVYYYYETIILNNDLGNIDTYINNNIKNLLNIENIEINLTLEDYTNISVNRHELVNKLKLKDSLLLYSDDLTNLSRFKSTYEVIINENILMTLLTNNINLNLADIENNTPVDHLIKQNNYKILGILKNKNILLMNNKYNNYIYNNLLMLINKIIPDDDISKNKLSDILNNFGAHLYKDINSLILANESFGNNILKNLEESFWISSYLTLFCLTQLLYNIDEDLTMSDLNYILSVLKFDINDLNKNYLHTNIKLFNVYDNASTNFKSQLLDEIKQEIVNLEKNKKTKEDILQTVTNNIIRNNINAEINEINNKLVDYNNNKNNIEFFINGNNNKIDNAINKDTQHVQFINGWNQLLNHDLTINPKNYNLFLLYLLENQKKLIKNKQFNILKKILPIFKHISHSVETYFRTKKDSNNIIFKCIRSIIIEITQLVIGTNLELIIRKVLYNYFNESLLDKINIEPSIEIVFDRPLNGYNFTLKDNLYRDLCTEMVKYALEIYDDNIDEKEFIPLTMRDLLLSYFDLFNFTKLKIPDNIIIILKTQIIDYFDTFGYRCIMLWLVNTENIFKYFIKNYRLLEMQIILN